jgi:hypothetical protein
MCDGGGGVTVLLFQVLVCDVAFGGGVWGALCGDIIMVLFRIAVVF